jgi:hypothetical protein
VSGDEAAALRILAKYRADMPLFAERCVRIKTKAGAIVPLRLNRAQLFVHQRLEEQRRRTSKVRSLIGKGRQTGGSTYIFEIGARFALSLGLRSESI